jgi:hypothetical protein
VTTLYITEYANLTFPNGEAGQMPLENPVAEQTVAIGGTSTQSMTFNPGTSFVRIHTDAICSVLFGTNPTASATSGRMAANQTEYRGVQRGQSFKVAVITNT